MPEGNCLEVCGATPGNPIFIEADIYFWMGHLCKKHGDNLLAYSYLTHAERMCRVSKIKDYHHILDLIGAGSGMCYTCTQRRLRNGVTMSVIYITRQLK